MNNLRIVVIAAISLLCSCKPTKIYHDFSFLKNNGVTVDSGLMPEEESRLTVMHPDSTWTWYGRLSTTYDLGYKLYCCSEIDSLSIFYGSDTLLVTDMLGPDSIYLDWFNLTNFSDIDVYRLINRRSGERHLYLSWGHDGLGNRPGRRLNLVFPLSTDERIEDGFAYVTNTFTIENGPCLDCFTDCNRDGKTDFVQWICSKEAPVRYFNFLKNGERSYRDAGYKSVVMYEGMSWGIVRKNQRRYPH